MTLVVVDLDPAEQKEAGLDPKKDLKLEYAGGHPEALLALTHGKVDAAEINTQQLASSKSEKQFDEAKFRRVWESDPIPNDPITVAKDLDPAKLFRFDESRQISGGRHEGVSLSATASVHARHPNLSACRS